MSCDLRRLFFAFEPLVITARMDSTLEAQWQSQADRRRRISKIMLLVVAALIFALVALWFWVTQPLLVKRKVSAGPTVDPARLESHVRKLSVEFVPRDDSHVENLDRVADYIAKEFATAGGVVSQQPYGVNGKTYRNVIARFGPESPERIIVGAHYDTAGPLPGADDNASGVAGLIELGYLLGRNPPAAHIELVAFSLEESPYFRTTGMGSSVHAQSLLKQNAGVKVMISLEMIGYFSDAAQSQNFPVAVLAAFYPSEGNFIGVVGTLAEGLMVRRIKSSMRAATPLPVYSINAPTIVPGVDFSDQLNYWNAGYHALMITDTAFFRNHNYHTPGDTAEKLDYKRMSMVVSGVYMALVHLATE